MLVGEGAKQWAKENGIQTVDNNLLITGTERLFQSLILSLSLSHISISDLHLHYIFSSIFLDKSLKTYKNHKRKLDCHTEKVSKKRKLSNEVKEKEAE